MRMLDESWSVTDDYAFTKYLKIVRHQNPVSLRNGSDLLKTPRITSK